MKEKLYLLGHQIAHSKSPAMHNALYKTLGLNWEYALMDCADANQAKSFLAKSAYLGLNITTPYKPLAFEEANIKAASAKLAGGANVVVRKGDALLAYNKDGEGCISYLEEQGFSFCDATIVVCGTGPTALSIFHAAALAGAAQATLLGRNLKRTEAALLAYRRELKAMARAPIELPALREGHRNIREAHEETDFAFSSYRAAAAEVFGEADLIINATPLGMREGDAAPFNTDCLQEHQTVYDVVYGHGQTTLVRAAQEAGCRVFDGSGMLVSQAVASAITFFEVTGVDFQATQAEMFALMAQAAGFEC
jgi:shikimate dehydrogenase